MVSERRERAQVILIGAVALAFIILGIVVVFNGVLYTETLSPGGASQSASDADVAELEVEQSVGCVLAWVDYAEGSQSDAEENITKFSSSYRNTTVGSTAVSVDVTEINVTTDGDKFAANVTIAYDSADLSYKRTQNITNGDCPKRSRP